MEVNYDICVEYDSLCRMEENLIKIQHNLENSTEKMKNALQVSQNFLTGYQFEKAKETTTKCVSVTSKSIKNIQLAQSYLRELRAALDEYIKSGYE